MNYWIRFVIGGKVRNFSDHNYIPWLKKNMTGRYYYSRTYDAHKFVMKEDETLFVLTFGNGDEI